MTTESTQTSTAAGAGTDQPSVQQGTGATGTQATTTERTFTQDDVNRLLAEEKRKAKADQDTKVARERQAAEDAAKLAAGEFQTVAEHRAARIAELEAKTQTTEERLTAVSEAMEKQAKARLRTLPEEIRAMAPEGDVLALYSWLEKAEAAAAKIGQQQRTVGTPSGPRGSGGAPPAGGAGDLAAQKRSSTDYSL